MTDGEMTLRRLLWLRHGCRFSALYGDDGEMQCHACALDFKRDPIDRIKKALTRGPSAEDWRAAADRIGKVLSGDPSEEAWAEAMEKTKGCKPKVASTTTVASASFSWPAPRIVCLCGSTRFWEHFRDWGLKLTLEGKIVLSIGICASDSMVLANPDTEEGKEQKCRLDELHKRKIDLADEVLILNVGGYIGPSTQSELDYAIAHRKKVRFLEGGDHGRENGRSDDLRTDDAESSKGR